MTTVIYTARKLVASNLNWFHATRKAGEAGRERALNINKKVYNKWHELGFNSAGNHKFSVNTQYYDGNIATGFPKALIEDKRKFSLQGGGKNWRIEGDSIKGNFYDLRADDLILMAFHIPSETLSWVAVRKLDNTNNSRGVTFDEDRAYNEIIYLLGKENADKSMWLIEGQTFSRIVDCIKPLYPGSREMLMTEETFINDWLAAIDASGFITTNDVARRLAHSLESKRFLILTGLSGAGKTILARAFANWISKTSDQYRVISVGANWVSNENIVGYPDALDKSRYQKTEALELVLKASANPEEPYFLILDEMNLSHVERYFADFLSSIESPSEPIRFHHDIAARDMVPGTIPNFPKNLFIIGTVNVDETTYMFSPKVLDRANVIEFRTDILSLEKFLGNPVQVDLAKIKSKGAAYAKHLVDSTNEAIGEFKEARISAVIRGELLLLFAILEVHGVEFGFRTVVDVIRYIEFAKRYMVKPVTVDQEDAMYRDAIDIQIMQKILPRLHGSKRRLEPLIIELLGFCGIRREWVKVIPSGATGRDIIFADFKAFEVQLKKLKEGDEKPLDGIKESNMYRISFEKLRRFRTKLQSDGFASYAEN